MFRCGVVICGLSSWTHFKFLPGIVSYPRAGYVLERAFKPSQTTEG